jgi:hypothetical protein
MSEQTQYKWLSNEPTDEMVNRVYSKLGKEFDKEFFVTMWQMMWQAAPEVEQEPAAMLFNLAGKLGATTAKEYALDIDRNAIPLYPHPQPKRELITDKEISDLYKSLPLDTREDVCSFSYKLGFKKAMELLNG